MDPKGLGPDPLSHRAREKSHTEVGCDAAKNPIECAEFQTAPLRAWQGEWCGLRGDAHCPSPLGSFAYRVGVRDIMGARVRVALKPARVRGHLSVSRQVLDQTLGEAQKTVLPIKRSYAPASRNTARPHDRPADPLQGATPLVSCERRWRPSSGFSRRTPDAL